MFGIIIFQSIFYLIAPACFEQLPPRFCASALWVRQALLPAAFPPALNEKEFVITGSGTESFQCNDTRRNLTDQQETSQWCGGIQVPKQILQALFSWGLI